MKAADARAVTYGARRGSRWSWTSSRPSPPSRPSASAAAALTVEHSLGKGAAPSSEVSQVASEATRDSVPPRPTKALSLWLANPHVPWCACLPYRVRWVPVLVAVVTVSHASIHVINGALTPSALRHFCPTSRG
jgi:hypothetical protein